MAEHIISLQASNLKRLTAVAIKLDENARTVIISGENGAGKSSVLDSIEFCLSGKSIEEKPIRAGKQTARVVLETETMIVTRTFSAESGENYLKFENKEGFRASSPQKLLDAMIEQIGFDPLEFSQMKPEDQGKKLLSIFPAKIDLTQNASFHKAAYEDRQVNNREIKRLDALIRSTPSPADDLPTQEVNISALAAQSTTLRSEMDEINRHVNTLNSLNGAIQRSKDREESIQKQLDAKMEALKKQMATLEEDGKAQITAERERRDLFEQQRSDLKNKDVRDPGVIQKELLVIDQKIQSAETTNSEVRRNQALKKTQEQFAAAEKISQDLTAKMEKLAADRSTALKDAKFPVPGLSIDLNGHVLLNEVPFAQASMAQKLIVGIAIAAASPSKLRVCLIRDASLLDAKSMKIVEEMAKEKDLQIWMERVEDSSPCAIQIVEGSNIGAKDADEVADPKKGEASKPEGALFGDAPPAATKKKGKKASAENTDPFKA